jgi:hypothetical protein
VGQVAPDKIFYPGSAGMNSLFREIQQEFAIVILHRYNEIALNKMYQVSI